MVFKPGKSGNPSGKPKGARNKTTVEMEKLLDDDAATITSKAIELAKNGDLTALRLCLERIIPPRKDRPVNFDMPEIKTPSDALLAVTAVMRGVAGGDLTPSEAQHVGKLADDVMIIAEAHHGDPTLAPKLLDTITMAMRDSLNAKQRAKFDEFRAAQTRASERV